MAETMRERLEADEDRRLAAWAARSARAERRLPVKDGGRAYDYRTHFQRDRDRIVYSRSFRRLRQKAQRGILPDYEDHRRNRLTHTLEVTQLARTIARALALNEDLVEAIALGHDLGQPAFGPAGELALDELMSGRLDGRGGHGLGDLGGFRRATQGLRVVDRIEKRYSHRGLNLTDDVREGIYKSGPADRGAGFDGDGLRAGLAPGLECQAVLLADRIAGAVHELDDALQAGAIRLAQVERLSMVAQLRKKLGDDYGVAGSAFVKINAVHRGLIHMLVTGAVLHSARALGRWAERHGIESFEQFLAVRDEILTGKEVAPPPAGRKMLDDLEGFLEARVRRGHDVDRVDGRGRRVLLGLHAAYQADPSLLPDHVLLRYKETGGVRFLRDLPRQEAEREIAARYRGAPEFVRTVVDHLAAMTDTFALDEHARLLEIGAVPIPGAEQLRREARRRDDR